MKDTLPPDWIGLLLPPVVVAGAIALIVLLVEKPEVRVSLIVFCGFVPAVSTLVWQRSDVRLGLFRLYYRYFGPNCNVRIVGDVPVNADQNDEDLLNEAVRLVMLLDPRAEQLAILSNRRSVKYYGRTLILDAVEVDAGEGETDILDWEGGDDDVDDAFEEEVVDRRVLFNLSGYAGKLTKVESLLGNEVALLLERLNGEMKRQGAQPMYSLRATVKGGNPFLVFYLKDVPSKDTELFNLSLVFGEGDSQVMVSVSMDFIDVSARTPTRLLDSARRYLASPALDRG